MKPETIQALTRISEIEADLESIEAKRSALAAELDRLWEAARADGITRTRPRKAKEGQAPATKRGANEVTS